MDVVDVLDDDMLGEMSRELDEDALTYSEMLPMDVLEVCDISPVVAKLDDADGSSSDELDAVAEVV
jgi:hypothetical protein